MGVVQSGTDALAKDVIVLLSEALDLTTSTLAERWPACSRSADVEISEFLECVDQVE